MRDYLVGRLDELPIGKGAAYQIGHRSIAVFRTEDKVRAISNQCNHRGAPMCDATLSSDGNVVRCPWHNWAFNLDTGQHCLSPAERIRTYDIRVEGDYVIVRA
jgi:nitrite reductase (NADH) small subunit